MNEVDSLVKDLKKFPEVMGVILFGSHATGRTKPLSDIDIAVLTEGNEIEADVSSHSSNTVDVVPFNKLPLYIQFEVLKTGKPLWIREKSYFMDLKIRILRAYLDHSRMYERISRRVLS